MVIFFVSVRASRTTLHLLIQLELGGDSGSGKTDIRWYPLTYSYYKWKEVRGTLSSSSFWPEVNEMSSGLVWHGMA